MNRLVHIYAALLSLAERPHHFRADASRGDEMQRVSADTVNDAARRSPVALVMVCTREVWELPAALLRDA